MIYGGVMMFDVDFLFNFERSSFHFPDSIYHTKYQFECGFLFVKTINFLFSILLGERTLIFLQNSTKINKSMKFRWFLNDLVMIGIEILFNYEANISFRFHNSLAHTNVVLLWFWICQNKCYFLFSILLGKWTKRFLWKFNQSYLPDITKSIKFDEGTYILIWMS